MMMFKYSLLAAAASTTVLAQNTNATSPICPFDRGTPSIAEISSPGVSVNSTGSVTFSFAGQDPWYLSVLVNNTSPSANRFSRQSFLSVKDDTQNASVCLYQFSALNATSNAGGCAGVFSDQCRDYLQQLLFNETNALYQEGDRCPNVWPAGRESQQHLRDLCGRISGNEWSPTRFSVPNHTCNYPSLPNVDLPDGYQTPFSSAGMKGLYNFFGDEPASTYDLYTQQVVSFVIVASFEGNQNNAVQFACVTPNSTQAGSRQPAQRPWENSAQDWQIPGRMLVSVAGLVALMLVL